jgi:hypothetical protein
MVIGWLCRNCGHRPALGWNCWNCGIELMVLALYSTVPGSRGVISCCSGTLVEKQQSNSTAVQLSHKPRHLYLYQYQYQNAEHCGQCGNSSGLVKDRYWYSLYVVNVLITTGTIYYPQCTELGPEQHNTTGSTVQVYRSSLIGTCTTYKFYFYIAVWSVVRKYRTKWVTPNSSMISNP